MLSSDFHCKENDGTTGAAHLIQASFFWRKTSLLWFARLLTLLISGYIAKKSESNVLLQSFRHFPYNENLTKALNTISLKCCLPSTDAIDRREKKSRIYMKVQGRVVQARFIEIYQVFAKINKVGYFYNRVVFFYYVLLIDSLH